MVSEAMKKLKKRKACGLDGLAAEHYIYADPILHAQLALLFNACISHGHLPKDFMKSGIVPIIKNKTASSGDKNNYRPVAVVSICSKLYEAVLMQIISPLLLSSENQFGFKQGHSTDQCIFTLKNVVEFYNSYSSPVLCCFLDASKAFDRVNHWTLFFKLLSRGVHPLIVRILAHWYRSQDVCVRWGNSLSSSFNVSNGVRQGSLLSPLLFSLYIDEISSKLKSSQIGCFVNNECFNHLMYADDLCLLAPTAAALQRLIDICVEVGNDLDVIFYPKKSNFIVFKPASLSLNIPPIVLLDKVLPAVRTVKYLGVLLNESNSDDDEILSQCRRLYARCNLLLRKFRRCSESVKKHLFITFCSPLYCMPLWFNFRMSALKKLNVAFNNVFRFIFNLDRRCSASAMFAFRHVNSFPALLRNAVFRFRQRVFNSCNVLVFTLVRNFDIFTGPMFSYWRSILYTVAIR